MTCVRARNMSSSSVQVGSSASKRERGRGRGSSASSIKQHPAPDRRTAATPPRGAGAGGTFVGAGAPARRAAENNRATTTGAEWAPATRARESTPAALGAAGTRRGVLCGRAQSRDESSTTVVMLVYTGYRYLCDNLTLKY